MLSEDFQGPLVMFKGLCVVLQTVDNANTVDLPGEF